MQNLIAIKATVENMMLQIGGAAPKPESPSDICQHPEENKTLAMGGYWTCTCGAEGRDV